MTVCAFLGGLTIPVLVELLKEPDKMLEAFRIMSAIAFTTSLSFFVAAIYIFDLLLMPEAFWGPIQEESKPGPRDRSSFALDYKMNGALYAYMVRTWRYFFGGGLGFILIGFFGLLFEDHLDVKDHLELRHIILLLGCAAGILSALMVWRKLRPELGVED